MPFTPAKQPFLLTKSERESVGQSFVQSLSFAVSVIILTPFKSKFKTEAEKFPFSVTILPDPGDAETAGKAVGVIVEIKVGIVVGFGDGVEVGVEVKVGLGEIFLLADEVDSFKAVLLSFF